MKVLYIAGSGRCGSTILDNILGQYEGFFSVGEIVCVWDYISDSTRFCGCGEPLSGCSVWREAMRKVFGENPQRHYGKLADTWRRSVRLRDLPLFLSSTLRGAFRGNLSDYERTVSRLYEALGAVTHSRVIVDSSKSPTYAQLLKSLPGVELHVVHLVRDPRGVAYSWSKRKSDGPEREAAPVRYMRQVPVWRSSIEWNAVNLSCDVMRRLGRERFLMLRYEDFIAEPRYWVGRILQMLGEHPVNDPFRSAHEVDLHRTHSVSGNPKRFRNGVVRLAPDDEWIEAMGIWPRRQVTALTWPGLTHFGYKLTPSGPAQA